MKKPRLLSLLLVLVLFSSLCILPAQGNSAQTYWTGVSSTGAVCQEEESPIEVKNELLTFHLSSLPDPYSGALGDDPSSVTAEYTFYNPSDYTVTARLLFPFGALPSYVDAREDSALYGDPRLFNVTTDGAPADWTLRHSYSPSFGSFSLEHDLGLIRDSFREDPFQGPGTSVVQYTYRVTDTDPSETHTIASFLMAPTRASCVYFPEQDCLYVEEDGTLRPGCSLWGDTDTLTLYVIGKPLDPMPQWSVLDHEDRPVPGSVTLDSEKTMTLEDYLLKDWTPDSGVSRVDWYNAMAERLIQRLEADGNTGLLQEFETGAPMETILMRWYSYEITLEPGQELVNTVTAPMFPDIDLSDSGALFRYTYLLSPAKTWSRFGPLDIRLDSPWYLAQSNLENWVPDENGFSLHLDGLPEGELSFTLSASSSSDPIPDPVPDPFPDPVPEPDLPQGIQELSVLTVLILLLFLVILPGLVVLIVLLSVRHRKKKK